MLETNYLIYNPYYYKETSKLRKAKELLENGKEINILTVSDFCKKLIDVDNSKGLKHTNENKKTEIPANLKMFRTIYNYYTEFSTGELYIKGTKKNLTEVIIPGCIEGKTVSIAQGAFERDRTLKKIVFSEGVREIGADSFDRCPDLKTIIINDSVKKIGSGAFHSCKNLESVEIPESVNEIGAGVFGSCPKIKLKVTAGSYAESYAKANGIAFEYI